MRFAMKTLVFGMVAAAFSAVPSQPPVVEKAVQEVVEIPVVPYKTSWECPGCSPEEQYVLKEL